MNTVDSVHIIFNRESSLPKHSIASSDTVSGYSGRDVYIACGRFSQLEHCRMGGDGMGQDGIGLKTGLDGWMDGSAQDQSIDRKTIEVDRQTNGQTDNHINLCEILLHSLHSCAFQQLYNVIPT